MSSNVKIQIAIDSKTGEARVEALGDKFQQFGRKGKKSLDTISDKAGRLRKNITPLIGLAGTLGAAFGAWQLSQLAGHMTDVATSFEQMEIKLDGLTKGKGKETLEAINKWALDMPVNTRQAVQTFAMMQAMGLDPTIEKMQILVDTSSIFGQETMPRVARALGQMISLGKLSAEELNQMSEAGINARKYLTEAFGMTVEELKKSQHSIEEIVDAIWNGLNADYAGQAQRAMASWDGMTTTFISYIEEIEKKLMQAGVFEEMKVQLSGVNDELARWLQTNESVIKQKVPEYIGRAKNELQNLWDIISYDPAIIEYGILGLALGGKKGAIVGGGVAHMINWAQNLYKAMGLVSKGQLDISQVAGANFKELEDLVAQFNKAPIFSGMQAQAAALRSEIKSLEVATSRIMYVGGTKERLAEARKELEQITREINIMQIKARAAAGEFDGLKDSWMKTGDAPKAVTNVVLTEQEKIENRYKELPQISKDVWLKMQENAKAAMEAEKDAWLSSDISVIESNEKVKAAVTETGEKIVSLTERTAWAMQRNFSDLFFDVMTGKFRNLNDFATGVLTSIQRATADYLGQLTKIGLFGSDGKGGLIQAGGTAIADYFSSNSYAGSGTYGVTPSAQTYHTTWHHKGGRAGSGTTHRAPAALFDHAPRLHKGLKPGEFPAILELGEEVKSKEQVQKDRAAKKEGDVHVHLNYAPTIQAIDTQNGLQFLGQHKNVILGLVNEVYNKAGKSGPLG